ncbi:MAG TPA: glutamate-1-semialdehyde 2,1-aminomutase [Planctomycetaceae bacterium]|nr:glutamate-1-semialdehyde 2,1-aminomutase [Planctomycetaceae bacterium]
MNHEKSKTSFERARRVIPGGVNSPARAFGGVGGDPLFIEKAQGSHLYDIDGNRLLDYVGSWGPHILGHNHPAVVAAVREALERGTSFGAPTEIETALAEAIIDAMPSIESVRMVNSGTEATMSAIRVARGFTGRDVIVKFAGCYHGHVDSLLVKAGSAATTLGVPSSPGIPRGCTADTVCLEFNNLEQVEQLFVSRKGEIACVILEPVVGNMGVVLPVAGFLEGLHELCRRHGTLLIFDEVMTGFRVAYRGAQGRFGIKPDLTTLGKIIGGGMPVGAYGGRADVMRSVSPVGPVYQAGTLSGNPLAMACGLATLRVLKTANPYGSLESETTRLVRGLSQAAQAAGIAHTVASIGSMFTLFFHNAPVMDYSAALHCDTRRFSRYFWGMIERGIYLPCSQFEANFVSAAHTPDEIDATISAAQYVLSRLA